MSRRIKGESCELSIIVASVLNLGISFGLINLGINYSTRKGIIMLISWYFRVFMTRDVIFELGITYQNFYPEDYGTNYGTRHWI